MLNDTDTRKKHVYKLLDDYKKLELDAVGVASVCQSYRKPNDARRFDYTVSINLNSGCTVYWMEFTSLGTTTKVNITFPLSYLWDADYPKYEREAAEQREREASDVERLRKEGIAQRQEAEEFDLYVRLRRKFDPTGQ